MSKLIKKALREMDTPMNADDAVKFQQTRLIPFQEMRKLAMKYITYEEWARENAAFGSKLNTIQNDFYSATEILDNIVSYKTKMALKHNKLVKDNPKTKAIIDVSDCLERYANDIGMYKSKVGGYKATKDALYLGFLFNGKICLPFKKCFVYTQLINSYSAVLEITDNENGTYSGTLWNCQKLGKLIQLSFNIERYEYEWGITVKMPLRQKPLGQILSNASVLLNTIGMLTKEDLDINGLRIQYALETFKDMFGYQFSGIATHIQLILSYLSSYKSKSVYKLSKDESNIYVYSDQVGECIDKYISENYPDYSSERIDGWLVGGNWNFLNPNEYGVDKNGKKIKGMTWNDPYKNHKNEQIVEANEQTTRLIPIHALERVKERYNVELTQEDLQEIANECLKGHATKLTVRDKFGKLNTAKGKKSCYRVKYKKNTFDVVLSDSHDKNSYRIATFLPKPKDKYPVIDSKDYMEVMTDVLDE